MTPHHTNPTEPAQAFWRRVAASVARDGVDERDLSGDRWNGLILRFHAG